MTLENIPHERLACDQPWFRKIRELAGALPRVAQVGVLIDPAPPSHDANVRGKVGRAVCNHFGVLAPVVAMISEDITEPFVHLEQSKQIHRW